MDLIQDIGAIAGLAAFLGLAVLALLYFAQARDVRQLRERAAFVPKDGERPASARAAAARAPATAVAQGAESAEAAERAAATDPRRAEQLEARRLAQIAREAAAERRARFERRQRDGGGGLGSRFELPEGRALIVVAIGVLLLGAGVVFGATRILGGDEEPSGGAQATKGPGVAKEQQAEIAVLNGTDVPGAAAETGAQLKQANYKLGAVTNSETPFDTTVVMYDAGGEETARAVATALGITEVQPIDPEIKGIAEGGTVAVVVGADRAGASEGGSATDTTASEF